MRSYPAACRHPARRGRARPRTATRPDHAREPHGFVTWSRPDLVRLRASLQQGPHRAGAMIVAEPTTFAALLRHFRLKVGLSQAGLAERAELSERAISDLERGLHATPQRQTVAMLAAGLGLSEADRARLEAAVVRRRGPARGRRPPASDGDSSDLALPSSPCRHPFPTPERLIGREAELA